jgi:acyl-CoA synthetase (AMP-forming)/AMP-acid ligase II
MADGSPAGAIPSTLMLQAAARFRDRVALRGASVEFTFSQFAKTADHIASSLSRLPTGSRVCLFMSNRAEYLLLQQAIERAGMVRVPVNAKSTRYELDTLIEDCEPAALFCDDTTVDRVEHLKSQLWVARVDHPDAAGGVSFADMLNCTIDESVLGAAQLDDLCSLNYTSGTSGKPKGVMLSHRNWAAVYRNMLIDRDIRGGDVLAHVGPLTHASGTYFAPWFLRGATNVIVEGGVEALLATIEREKVSVFTCVPTVLTRIVNYPEIDRFDLSTLRMIGYGAEPIPFNTLQKAIARFGMILVQNYGQTEAMMTCITLPASEHFDAAGKLRVGCIGRPYTFVRIVLRDDEGKEVPVGVSGEITIKSDHVMMGYWRRPAETAESLRNGWLWTGDLARRDSDGLISLTGRKKEMLISGGHNIYPQELEAALTSLPGIAEAAVIAQPDPDWGEIAVAFVSLADEASFQSSAISAAVKPRLGIKTPKRIEIVSALPKTGNGKVDKKALQALLAGKENALQ